MTVVAQFHSELKAKAEESAVALKGLEEKDYLAALKNNKGKLSLNAVRSRAADLGEGAEYDVLTKYLELDTEQKAASKRAKELLKKVEEKIFGTVGGR